jgi:hypothetical protein
MTRPFVVPPLVAAHYEIPRRNEGDGGIKKCGEGLLVARRLEQAELTDLECDLIAARRVGKRLLRRLLRRERQDQEEDGKPKWGKRRNPQHAALNPGIAPTKKTIISRSFVRGFRSVGEPRVKGGRARRTAGVR